MIKRYVPLEYFGGMGLSIEGDYVLYVDYLEAIAERDAEIERLSNIINRQHADCENLKTKLESKLWEIQALDREIKRCYPKEDA